MKNKKLKISTLILFGIGLTGLQAQESINTTGGDATGSGGSVSYSIGQIAYSTNVGSNGSVAQGVQQAFEISVLGVEEVEVDNISINAYPNPTSNYLTLEINNLELSNLTFQLFDIQGRLLQSQKIIDNQTRIEMDRLTVATYFVKVSQDKKEVKTFKIVKN